MQENSNGALDASEQNLIDMRVERNTLKSSCEMLEALLNEQIEHAAKQHRVILTSVQKPLRDQLSHLNQVCAARQLTKLVKKGGGKAQDPTYQGSHFPLSHNRKNRKERSRRISRKRI